MDGETVDEKGGRVLNKNALVTEHKHQQYEYSPTGKLQVKLCKLTTSDVAN